MVSEYKLHIGSFGWQYKSWQESFYPEDLPEDWQFAYYANEYSVLMIPWELLQNDVELLKQGVEDSDEKCRLIFEFPVENINLKLKNELIDSLHEFLNRISFTGSRLMGVVLVLQENELNLLSNEQFNLLKELLKISKARIASCLQIPEISSFDRIKQSVKNKLAAVLNESGTDLCRRNEITTELVNDNTSNLHITFCDITSHDPKHMRKIVENSLGGECEGSTNVLIFRSEIPEHEQMNTAAIISDLL